MHRHPILGRLLEMASEHGCEMDALARMGFERPDRAHFAQLISYRLDGYAELAYASDEDYGAAVAMAKNGLSEPEARATRLQGERGASRSALREPPARLFGFHPSNFGPA